MNCSETILCRGGTPASREWAKVVPSIYPLSLRERARVRENPLPHQLSPSPHPSPTGRGRTNLIPSYKQEELSILGKPFPHTAEKRRGARGFSLVEMMVAVGILAMIIVGLLAMFSQTSRALRSANNQTDVLESGRLMMEMMTREVQQAIPTGQDNQSYHFFASRIAGAAPLNQRLPGGGTLDNDLEAFFFITKENTTYKGIGYFVDPAANGVGTLYRFYMETNSAAGSRVFYHYFTNEIARLPDSPLMHRVADGVVQLEVHVYDAEGVRPSSGTNQWVDANVAAFWGDALPAFVELKLAVLELHLVERIKHMDPTQARAFLEDERRTAQTHLFRQRIPLLAAPRP